MQAAEVNWRKLTPSPPLLVFTPNDDEAELAYREFWSIAEILAVNGGPTPGIVTTHDEFAISFSRNEAIDKVTKFLETETETDARKIYRLCSQNQWSYDVAKADLPKINISEIARKIEYRPFDVRWTIWNSNVAVHRRRRTTDHFDHQNIGLIFVRQISLTEHNIPLYAFVCNNPIDNRAFVSSRGVAFMQPLYLYPPRSSAAKGKVQPSFHAQMSEGIANQFAGNNRIENISSEFRTWLDTRYATHHSPETLLGYIYAVLHAPAYRSAYADFLRSDFPRVPFAGANADFVALAALGSALIDAHLLRSVPQRGLGTYTGKGDNTVESFAWRVIDSSLPINATQRFANIPEAVWTFTIGGYQVLRQYLKSRKGRTLTLAEIETVENVANVLAFTIDQMALIDTAYAQAFATTA